MSFRLRIAVLSAMVSGLVLLGFGAASWWLIRQQRIAAVDTELRALGSRHPGWLANRSNFDRFNRSLEYVFGEEHRGRVILLVKESSGRTLYVSPGWPSSLSADEFDCSLDEDPSATVPETGSDPERAGPPWGMGRGAGRGRRPLERR